MANETKIEPSKVSLKTRRAFVTTAAQVAVTAPAVAMLLSASTKPAAAQTRPYGAESLQAFDDGTGTGNDVCTGGTNLDATFGCVN